ncbi:hypothetical protein V6N13_126498 [Hibiscus sabdariffa]
MICKTNPPTPFPLTVLDSTVLLNVAQHQSLKCTDEDSTTEGVVKRSQSTLARTLVSWRASCDTGTVPTLIIAHEFYDELPVHQFQACLVHSNTKV